MDRLPIEYYALQIAKNIDTGISVNWQNKTARPNVQIVGTKVTVIWPSGYTVTFDVQES